MNNGIKAERLKALKGKYQKPEISSFIIKGRNEGECSDMASEPGCPWYTPGCGNDVYCACSPGPYSA